MVKRTVLYAEEGKVLTNGDIYGRQIFLAEGLCDDSFYEISEEEYHSIFSVENSHLEEEYQPIYEIEDIPVE